MSHAEPELDTTENWAVKDTGNGNVRAFEDRSSAEHAVSELESLDVDTELYPPGEPVDGDSPEPEIIDGDATDAEIIESEVDDLPERNVGDDPINWMPGDFVDEIDGVPAVNRKGFEVLSHFYDIDVYSDLEVAPEDTDFEYCRVKAKAVTADGRECEAYGSSHKKRGDDEELLLEMADTRARKRALSIATGVGAVAVEELKEGTAKQGN